MHPPDAAVAALTTVMEQRGEHITPVTNTDTALPAFTAALASMAGAAATAQPQGADLRQLLHWAHASGKLPPSAAAEQHCSSTSGDRDLQHDKYRDLAATQAATIAAARR